MAETQAANLWLLMMKQSPDLLRVHDGVRFPYPFWFYPLRIVWVIVWGTIWKLCWKRSRFGRPLILRIFGAEVDLRAEISGSAKIQFPWLVKAGSYIAIGPRVTLYNLNVIEIGDQVIISQDAYLCGGTHDYTLSTIPLVRKKIKIGSGAWIGAGAYIGPGVTIGEGSVVGARAVVVKDVEPWTVVAGNPARVLKNRIIQAECRSDAEVPTKKAFILPSAASGHNQMPDETPNTKKPR